MTISTMGDIYKKAQEDNDLYQRYYSKLPTYQLGNIYANLRENIGQTTTIPGLGISGKMINDNTFQYTDSGGNVKTASYYGGDIGNNFFGSIIKGYYNLPNFAGSIESGGTSEGQYQKYADYYKIPYMSRIDYENQQNAAISARNGVETEAQRQAKRDALGITGSMVNGNFQASNSITNPSNRTTTDTSATAGKSTTETAGMKSDMTIDKLMSDPRVKNDKGFNGVTMAEWLQGNATLIPKLASLGYTVDDLINEAYSQTRTNKSAFSKDMTTTGRLENVASGTQSGATAAATAQTSSDRDARTKQALTEWNAKATAAGFPQELIDMGATAIASYAGDTFDNTEIINTFNKIKNETIDPYYKELADVAIKDFTTANQNLMTDRERELEAERSTAGQNIRQAKEGQEAAGMTFTGKAIQNLGAESAYAQEQSPTVATPTQTPFGGMFYEGTVNQANRLISTSSAARYAQAQQALGRKAEDYLGTSGVSGLGINYTPAGVTKSSELETAKQKDYASTLQFIIDQYKTKQETLTNKI